VADCKKSGISVLRRTTKDLPHEITKNASHGVNGRIKNGCPEIFQLEEFLF
jgi:hypothetical protein